MSANTISSERDYLDLYSKWSDSKSHMARKVEKSSNAHFLIIFVKLLRESFHYLCIPVAIAYFVKNLR